METKYPTKKELFWYARWRPKIWAKVLGDTIGKIGWDNFQGKKVLELGYGDGRIAVMFARHGALYTGYEIKNEKLALAQKTVAQAGVSDKVELCVGDFMKLQDKSYDYIFVKSVLFRINKEEIYLAWLKKINSMLVTNGKFIALENAKGIRLNYWIRNNFRRSCYWADNLLYSSQVEGMYYDTFSHVDVQYYYILAHLSPCPSIFARVESLFAKPNADNCFVAGLICQKGE